MSAVRSWLDERRPPAPPELRVAIESAVDEAERVRGPFASVGDHLRAAAEGCLDRSLASPGRVRESAFELLAADALLTYACEAALGSDDPEAPLAELLRALLPDRAASGP